ncbi:protein kinase domain-containing protein [Spongorhabdus nitratireducens]
MNNKILLALFLLLSFLFAQYVHAVSIYIVVFNKDSISSDRVFHCVYKKDAEYAAQNIVFNIQNKNSSKVVFQSETSVTVPLCSVDYVSQCGFAGQNLQITEPVQYGELDICGIDGEICIDGMERVSNDSVLYFSKAKYVERQLKTPFLVVERKSKKPLIIPWLSGKGGSTQYHNCADDGCIVSRQEFHLLQARGEILAFIELPNRCLCYSVTKDEYSHNSSSCLYDHIADPTTPFLIQRAHTSIGEKENTVAKEVERYFRAPLLKLIHPVIGTREENSGIDSMLFDVYWPGQMYEGESIDICLLGSNAPITYVRGKKEKTTRTLQLWHVQLYGSFDPTISYVLRFKGKNDWGQSFPFMFNPEIKANSELKKESIWSYRSMPPFEVVLCSHEEVEDRDQVSEGYLFQAQTASESYEEKWDLQSKLPVEWRSKYVLGEMLGGGNESDIFPCTTTDLKKYVFRLDKKARPEKEVNKELAVWELVKGLRHPNVVHVVDVVKVPDPGGIGELNYRLAVVMEFCEGDLQTTLKGMNDKKVSSDQLKDYTRQILSGVSALHSLRIVHHDLKPQNILKSHDGFWKLSDFGVAEVLDDSGISHQLAGCQGVFGFTPDYFSAGCDLAQILTDYSTNGYRAYEAEIKGLFVLRVTIMRQGFIPMAQKEFRKKVGWDTQKQKLGSFEEIIARQLAFFYWLNTGKGIRPELSLKARISEVYTHFHIDVSSDDLDFDCRLLGSTSPYSDKGQASDLLRKDPYFK